MVLALVATVTLLVAGCSTNSSVISTQAVPATAGAPSTTVPPTTQVPTTTSSVPPTQPPGQPPLLSLVQTVEVTSEADYPYGGFVRINYVPASDRFVVTFGCAYREYDLGMVPTGVSGDLNCEGADAGFLMVDNFLFHVTQAAQAGTEGWRIFEYDAATWQLLTDTFFPLGSQRLDNGDPMVAYVNGRIDISSGYTVTEEPPDADTPAGEYGTHHQFFSLDLQFLEERIITEPPHIHGHYMVFVDGIYYLVTASLYTEDVILAKYDTEWNYLGGKTLIPQAHFSTGLVFDGQRFYVAYTDTSQRTEPGFFPVALNIHLAAFDRDWNLVEDVAVTDFSWEDGRQPGRPWVTLHANRLYVSYDVDVVDPATHQEQFKPRAMVSVYELTRP